ncbi:MAG: type I restriction enzyme HsdR N-terminal domain-containing protein [Bacteroidales bacterium]|nr:type I restriction enzyme HsdR N-terminal domain-containing protein [Bacteroidales bacterium]
MPEAEKYYDPLRRKAVAATPEEKVRQWFIAQLLEKGGVPRGLMMSEVQMKSAHKPWRADIVVYSGTAAPLAVVECKRPDVQIDAEVAGQALRYYSVLGVKYIFLTNGGGTFIYVKEGEAFRPLDHFPTYSEMNGR